MTLQAPRTARHSALHAFVSAASPSNDIAHDIHHIDRVYQWSLRLASDERVDIDLAGAAALVHDLAVIPKNDAARAQGGERSSRLAEEPLRDVGYTVSEIAEIGEKVWQMHARELSAFPKKTIIL